MKRFFFGSIVWLFVFSLWGAPAFSQETKGPRIVMEEKEFDFKEVKEGEVLEHDFKVLNKGDEVLQVISVKPG